MKTANAVAADFVEYWELGKSMATPLEHLLTAFAKEQVLEDRMQRTADDIYKLSYERGRAEALEEAVAVVMEKRCGHQLDIAQKIRDLKKS